MKLKLIYLHIHIYFSEKLQEMKWILRKILMSDPCLLLGY